MLLAEITEEVRWIIGVTVAGFLAIIRWVYSASSRATQIESKADASLDVGKQAHRRISLLSPRVDQLELHRASDHATLQGLSQKLDEKTVEIRGDITNLRSDIQKALIEGARNHKSGS